MDNFCLAFYQISYIKYELNLQSTESEKAKNSTRRCIPKLIDSWKMDYCDMAI